MASISSRVELGKVRVAAALVQKMLVLFLLILKRFTLFLSEPDLNHLLIGSSAASTQDRGSFLGSNL